MKYRRILGIPDIQAPYAHKDALKFLRELKREVRPDLVMCLGDELDQRTLSRYPSDPSDPSGGDEYEEAMVFWKEMYKIFPVARSVHSNHVERVFKKAAEAGIPHQYLKNIRGFMQAPAGWQWEERWEIDKIHYEHGERASGSLGLRNLVLANGGSTVIGHHHESPGTTFISNGRETWWGMNVGCLVDQNGAGLRYTKKNRHKPVLGTGGIFDGVPHFFPL